MNEPVPSTSSQAPEDTKPTLKEEITSQPLEIKSKRAVQYFQCSTCSLKEKFDYFGDQPPKMKRFRYAEHCYLMVDPFVPPNRGEYLVLGAHCVMCNRTVCRDTCCSFYFGGTHCIKCAKANIAQFPKVVQEKLNKINLV